MELYPTIPIQGFWIDDEPDDIEEYRKYFENLNIKFSVFKSPDELQNALMDDAVEYTVGLVDLDLKKTSPNFNGIDVACYANGLYLSKYDVHSHLIAVTRHLERYKNVLDSENPFITEYDKTSIKLDHLFNSIKENHFLFNANRELKKYNETNSIYFNGIENFDIVSVLFGYIEDFDEEYGYALLWSSIDIVQPIRRKINIEVLKVNNVLAKYQAFRFAVCELKGGKGEILTKIDAVGSVNLKNRVRIFEDLNYEGFDKKRSNIQE